MKIYRDLASLIQCADLPKTAVALGLFDGVHLGHRAVIKAAVDQKKNGLTPAVFTFSTNYDTPASKGNLEFICTDSDRLAILESLGVEIVFMPEFEEIKGQTPIEFISDTLCDKFRAGFVSCGFNFHFGAKGAGTTELLAKECSVLGIALSVIEQKKSDGDTVSSSRIRKLLGEGRVEEANTLLGRRYFISGEVVHGFSIGNTIGFPTANQEIAVNRLVPKHGVYATLTEIDGRTYRSVTNIGIKPTIAGKRWPLSETHIIGYDGDIYGKSIKVSFLSFLRPEQKFSGLEQLKAQIVKDTDHALSIPLEK